MGQPETTALTPVGDVQLAHMTPEQIDEAVASIERVANAKKKMIRAALALTYTHDWIDHGGAPYLEGEGAQRLCAVGIKLSEPVFDERREGDNLFVECMLQASWTFTAQTVTEIGRADTLDKMWDNTSERCALAQYRERAGGNEKLARLMMLGNVRKKALMNATSRVVRAVMGIKGLTWEDLAALGLTREKAGAKVDYKKGATRKTAKAAKEKPAVVELKAMLALPVGSRCGVTATVKKAATYAKMHTLTVTAGADECTILMWKSDVGDVMPEGVVEGEPSHFPDVDLRDYQGKLQYVAHVVELVTDGT